MKLTDSQKAAIETIDENVAVNAGAGSGKTRVLVERYINILENGDLEENREVESIVAITFTKKAAAEMKERVRKAVLGRINTSSKWKRIYRDLERANISTIHSFCSKILRENPIEGQIDPGFSLMDDYESNNLLKNVIETYIMEALEGDEGIFELIRYFTASAIDSPSGGIVKTIMDIYTKIRSTGITFEEVKKMTLKTINEISEDGNITDGIKEKFEYLISKARKNSKLGKLANDSIWIDFKNKQYDKIDDGLLNTLAYLSSNIGTMKGEEGTIDELNNLISQVYKVKEKKKKHIYETFLDILIEVHKRYSHEKRKRGFMDYEDLQIEVLTLLENDEVRKKYQNRFRYIMVDEFQDTNELQKKIIYKLCSKDTDLDRNNLFVVGDPKQSIYAFRGADVDVFYEVVNDIERVSGQKAISLKDNFRTVDNVMGFVNVIFKRIMGDLYEELIPNKSSKNEVDVEIIEEENLEPPEGVSHSEYALKYESELIAKRIKKMVEEGKYQYKDIAILFRSTTDNGVYEEALKNYGIPFYNLGGGGFYKKQEIIDIINGLRAINNKYDTLSYIAILRSPMFGLSDRAIYWIVRKNKNSILEFLNEDINELSSIDKERAKKAHSLLSRLSVMKSVLKVHELIEELINETYYLETWMLKFGNKQAMANVYKFIEKAREFSNNENRGLEDFIDYVENRVSEDFDEGQFQIESEDGDSVKLMTIHKSKGLQFKVVIVPQMAKQFNFIFGNVLFDKQNGVGIKHPEVNGKLSKDISPLYNEILIKQREKEIEENKRILYVAMTRAEEKLVLGNQSSRILKESFKKLINDYLEDTKFEKINSLEVEREELKKIIDIPKVEKQPHENKKTFPLLISFDNYQGKSFDRVSITQYMTFKECKRRFYMTYYKNLPIDEIFLDEEYDFKGTILDPSLKGQIVHKICELYKKGVDIKEITQRAISMYGLEPRKEIFDEVIKYANNYVKNYIDDYDFVFNEREFYYKIGNKYIYGIVDRINIKGNQAEIIDFKTNKFTNREWIIKKYSPQIQLYAKAFKDIYGLNIKRAGLLMLETGDFIDIQTDDDLLDRNIKDIEKFIDFINNNIDIEKYERGQNNCSYCKFSGLCR